MGFKRLQARSGRGSILYLLHHHHHTPGTIIFSNLHTSIADWSVSLVKFTILYVTPRVIFQKCKSDHTLPLTNSLTFSNLLRANYSTSLCFSFLICKIGIQFQGCYKDNELIFLNNLEQ